MKETLISVLKPFAQGCFNLVNKVSTQSAVLIYVLVLAAVALWVLTLKQERPKKSDWPGGEALVLHDLRFWAVVIVVLQIIVYIVVG